MLGRSSLRKNARGVPMKISHHAFTNRRFAVILSFVGLVLVTSATLAVAQAGQLDPSFGTNGIFSDTFSGATGSASAVLLQSDGKVVAAGLLGVTNSTSQRGVVVRLNTNGTLDSTFGTGGVVTIKFGDIDEVLTGLAIQTDGKILVAGSAFAGGSGLIARLNTNGSLDSSFGTSGFVPLYPVTPGPLALLPNGKIILVGLAPGTSSSVVPQMQRFNSNGQIDTTFGSGGAVPILFFGSAIKVQSNGKFLITSSGFGSGTVARYNSNGQLDTTFGIVGQQSALAASGILLQANGQIVTAGSIATIAVQQGNQTAFGLMRFNITGVTDGTFGTRGAVVTSFANLTNASADALAIQSNGDIVAAGSASNGGSQPTGGFAMTRYSSTGQLDTTFGTAGFVTTGFGNGVTANIAAIAIQTDGNIVVAGSTSNGQFVVARYLGN
jgi:uncharacterized delta-60 repeat protein